MSAKLAAVATALAMALALASVPGCNTTEIDKAGNGPMAFAATPGTTGDDAPNATVILRSRSLLLTPAGQVIVDVVARGATDLHGAAFRMTWDPATLRFVGAQTGPAWSNGAIALAKEGTPGQLAVVWTEKGETSHDATGETVLGTLTFAVLSRKSTDLAFMNERAQMVGKSGAPLAVTWRGGTVAAR